MKFMPHFLPHFFSVYLGFCFFSLVSRLYSLLNALKGCIICMHAINTPRYELLAVLVLMYVCYM